MAEGTGVVDYNSPLVRSKWMAEGLIQKASTSWWAPYTGRGNNSIVTMETDISANKAGKTVIYDWDGHLVEGPVKGKETAFGKGEEKRKFSDSVTIERYRFPVDNGDKFDGLAIGDLSINEHEDSRAKLADKWIRFRDQSKFDVAQQSGTHIMKFDTFDLKTILSLSNIIKMGGTYDVGGRRLPLEPFYTVDGDPIWLMVVDSAIMTKSLTDDNLQRTLASADYRGNENRLFRGVLGKIGNFVIVEGPSFFGKQAGPILTDVYADMSHISELQMSGLRQYIDDGSTTFEPVKWSGNANFYVDAGKEGISVYSRGLILGARAMQEAFGRMPDYKCKQSQDFDIKSESVCEVWTNNRAVSYKTENVDYDTKIGGISNGIIEFDVKI